MVYQRTHKASSWNPQSQGKSSQFAPRPFAVQAQQDSRRPLTQQEIENEAFQQNKFEAFGLQLKEKSGTITPVEQEKLGVLQAKMDDFWAQRMEQVKAQPNLLEILSRTSQATPTTESQSPVQPNTIQAKSETPGDRPNASGEQRPNKTGMPDALKAGVESISGYSLDNVRVHYSSPKPAPLQALAYTQGTEIHVAPGQERHLPHEAWHVVQQAQGRVQPTMQLKDGVPVNDDQGLEHEADVMGEAAAGAARAVRQDARPDPMPPGIAQRQGADEDELQMKAAPAASRQLEAEPAPPPNRTGMPEALKSGIESLSAMAMDNVQVLDNSMKPAQLTERAKNHPRKSRIGGQDEERTLDSPSTQVGAAEHAVTHRVAGVPMSAPAVQRIVTWEENPLKSVDEVKEVLLAWLPWMALQCRKVPVELDTAIEQFLNGPDFKADNDEHLALAVVKAAAEVAHDQTEVVKDDTALSGLVEARAMMVFPEPTKYPELHQAVIDQNYESISKLAPSHDVNERSTDGYTPLGIAIKIKDSTAARLLLERKASASRDELVEIFTNQQFATIWDTAAQLNKQQVGELVVDLKFSSNCKGFLSLARVAPSELRVEGGLSILHLAVKYRCDADECTKVLEMNPGNCNASDVDGKTPLHYAAQSDLDEVARVLLRHDADPSKRDARGKYPIALTRATRMMPILGPLTESKTVSMAITKVGDDEQNTPARLESMIHLQDLNDARALEGNASKLFQDPALSPLMTAISKRKGQLKIIGAAGPYVANATVVKEPSAEGWAPEDWGAHFNDRMDRIYFGAGQNEEKEKNDDEQGNRKWGTILHESTHHMMQKIFGHGSPYGKENESLRKAFGEIREMVRTKFAQVSENGVPVQGTAVAKACEETLRDAFGGAYPADSWDSELIARVPEILGTHGKEGKAWLSKNVPELLEFWNVQVVPELNKYK